MARLGQPRLHQGNYLTIGDTVSDHLPVWMSFDVSSDDD